MNVISRVQCATVKLVLNLNSMSAIIIILRRLTQMDLTAIAEEHKDYKHSAKVIKTTMLLRSVISQIKNLKSLRVPSKH